MNVSKQVFSRLFKEDKTELESNRFEFNLMSDADKFFKQGMATINEGHKSAKTAGISYKFASHQFGQAIDVLEEGLKKAKDLGADSFVKDINKKISQMEGYEKQAKGFQKDLGKFS